MTFMVIKLVSWYGTDFPWWRHQASAGWCPSLCPCWRHLGVPGPGRAKGTSRYWIIMCHHLWLFIIVYFKYHVSYTYLYIHIYIYIYIYIIFAYLHVCIYIYIYLFLSITVSLNQDKTSFTNRSRQKTSINMMHQHDPHHLFHLRHNKKMHG